MCSTEEFTGTPSSGPGEREWIFCSGNTFKRRTVLFCVFFFFFIEIFFLLLFASLSLFDSFSLPCCVRLTIGVRQGRKKSFEIDFFSFRLHNENRCDVSVFVSWIIFYATLFWFRPPAFQDTQKHLPSFLWLITEPRQHGRQQIETENTEREWIRNRHVFKFFANNLCLHSSGGANHVLRGELCEPSLEHHEKLPVHGCQPAAL